MRYTPSDCFETFPFPQNPTPKQEAALERIGEAYHEHRRQVMKERWIGLTKTYNLFHDPNCTDDDIAHLRVLHVEMDQAVLAAYGWEDIDLGHDFREAEWLPGKDRLRYTITPEARDALLERLLELNKEIAEAEKKAPAKAKAKAAPVKRIGKIKTPDLFDLPQQRPAREVEQPSITVPPVHQRTRRIGDREVPAVAIDRNLVNTTLRRLVALLRVASQSLDVELISRRLHFIDPSDEITTHWGQIVRTGIERQWISLEAAGDISFRLAQNAPGMDRIRSDEQTDAHRATIAIPSVESILAPDEQPWTMELKTTFQEGAEENVA